MPRDINGNYTLPAGNPVVTGTPVSSTWANATLADIQTALTDSLSRSGDGGMLAPFLFSSGNIGAPGIAWEDEATSGFYRAAAGDFRYTIGGVDIIKILAASLAVPSLISAGVINGAAGANIASAGTVNLTTATGNIAHVTGTTSITAVTLGAGNFRQVIFDGILTLTHHATNNNLPGAANITTAAGDRALYWSDGTTVYCVAYQKADGTAVVAGASAPFTDTTAIVKGSADATKLLRFEVDGFTTGTTRVLTPPNFDGTIATLAGTETLTNKTLTSPVMTSPALGTVASGNVDACIGGVRPAFAATASGGQSVTSLAFTKIQYASELFDTNTNYDSVTNYRFTPTVAGKYIVCMCTTISAINDGKLFLGAIFKNGAEYARGASVTGAVGGPSSGCSAVIDMNGTTDYVEGYAYNGDAVSQNLSASGQQNNFSASRIA